MKKEKKLIAIGDVHGSSIWKKVVQKEDLNTKILFIGDYFDSFFIPPVEQIQNFKEIVKLKLADPEMIVLLMGNHELHYLSTVVERYSGYQAGRAEEIGKLVAPLILNKTIVACHKHGDFIFSHAGFTKTWCKNHNVSPKKAGFVEKVNNLLLDDIDAFCYNNADRTGYGESVVQGPMWVRPKSLLADSIKGFTQVVGHTSQENINYQKNCIFIDTIDSSHEYLSIDKGKAKTKKI